MKALAIFILLLGVSTPSILYSQKKNRISIQTGMFHQFFDGTPIVNKTVVTENTSLRHPQYMFGGHLNDSWGIQYQRLLTEKSMLSCEYMQYQGGYHPIFVIWQGEPRIYGRRLNKINVTYSRKLAISKRIKFNYGAGINYKWGLERYFLSSGYHGGGFWEYEFTYGDRKDFGLNTRLGFEYSPVEWLTLFSYLDFQWSAFVKSKGVNEVDTYEFMDSNYGIKRFPSRYDLSLNFGIGYNF